MAKQKIKTTVEVPIIKSVPEKKSLTRFNVSIEDGEGEVIAMFYGIVAQTKHEANHKVLNSLTFSARRSLV